MGKHSQVGPRHNLLYLWTAIHLLPLRRRARLGWLSARRKRYTIKRLKELHEHERCLIICELQGNSAIVSVPAHLSALTLECSTYLLAKTNPGPCVEWQEDERVRDEVLLHALIEESIGIKAFGFTKRQSVRSSNWISNMVTHRRVPRDPYADA